MRIAAAAFTARNTGDAWAAPTAGFVVTAPRKARRPLLLSRRLRRDPSSFPRSLPGNHAGHVRAAAELGAVQTLLLTDSLFRTNDVAERRRWVALVDSVKGGGGEVHIFSSAHVSGEQLGQISGAAALLRFPLPELEDQEL